MADTKHELKLIESAPGEIDGVDPCPFCKETWLSFETWTDKKYKYYYAQIICNECHAKGPVVSMWPIEEPKNIYQAAIITEWNR